MASVLAFQLLSHNGVWWTGNRRSDTSQEWMSPLFHRFPAIEVELPWKSAQSWSLNMVRTRPVALRITLWILRWVEVLQNEECIETFQRNFSIRLEYTLPIYLIPKPLNLYLYPILYTYTQYTYKYYLNQQWVANSKF